MAPLFGLVVFVIGIFISRVIMTRALNRLTDEDKLLLVKAFSGQNLLTSAIYIVLLVGFVVTFYFSSEFYFFEIAIFMLLFLLFVSYFSLRNYQKLTRLSLPYEYLRSYLAGSVIVFLGVLGMAVITVYSVLPSTIKK